MSSSQSEDAKNKADVTIRQYSNAQMKYTKGNIAQIDLLQALVIKEEKYGLLKLCYQKMFGSILGIMISMYL